MKTNDIFIVTPKRDHRQRLMPRLKELLTAVNGVQIIGQGATCVKISVPPGLAFQQNLAREVRDLCFIEPAVVFDLAEQA